MEIVELNLITLNFVALVSVKKACTSRNAFICIRSHGVFINLKSQTDHTVRKLRPHGQKVAFKKAFTRVIGTWYRSSLPGQTHMHREATKGFKKRAFRETSRTALIFTFYRSFSGKLPEVNGRICGRSSSDLTQL
jgi:hypothetical protein